MYMMKKRVPYSEIDASGRMTLPAIVESLQDCATFHSEDVGITLRWLMDRSLAWVTASWRIVIRRWPVFGEEIEVETRPYKLAHSIGKRTFEIRGSGESLVVADSQWVFTDIRQGKKVNLPDDFVERYGIDEPFEGSISPVRRLRRAGEMTPQGSFPVALEHIDTNHHVNNVQYVRMAMGYLPKGINEFRIEYIRSAVLGDTIVPRTGALEGSALIDLADPSGNPFVIMEVR